MSNYKVKTGPLIGVLAVVLIGLGLFYANRYGYLDRSSAGPAAVPQQAALPDAPVEDSPSTAVAQLPLPSMTPTAVPGPEIRAQIMAWNSQMGWIFANGGPKTTQGSLMAKHGVNLTIVRQDDVMKQQADLIAFAKSLKDGNPNPTEGAHFMAVMGDGAAATIAGMEGELKKLGPEYMAEVVGSAGYSRGEDKLMGPAEWKKNPQLSRGALISGYLRDGDWNIAMKWAGDNGIKNNPDEKSWDPDALNWYSVDSFLQAAEVYNTNVCEDRPIVRNGKRTGERKNVCVNSVVTWTPGDVNVAKNRGGLASIVSTKEYRSQMPNTIIGIRKWNQDNRKSVEAMLAAMYEGGDQVKAFPAALQRAGEASAAVYKEETAAYWIKYYKGTIEKDSKGLDVELGGSSVNNLQDALHLYGLLPGSANLFAATYTVFGDIVKQQYPKLVPSYPPVTEVLNTSYIEAVAKRNEVKSAAAELPKFQASTEVTKVVSKRAWSIEFETGKATFTPSSMQQLEELKNGLLVADELKIEVHGHTDNTGDAGRNLTLSQSRAQAVKTWLRQQSSTSFPEYRFAKIEGHGQDRPLESNDNALGRSKNRRVEVVLGN